MALIAVDEMGQLAKLINDSEADAEKIMDDYAVSGLDELSEEQAREVKAKLLVGVDSSVSAWSLDTQANAIAGLLREQAADLAAFADAGSLVGILIMAAAVTGAVKGDHGSLIECSGDPAFNPYHPDGPVTWKSWCNARGLPENLASRHADKWVRRPNWIDDCDGLTPMAKDLWLRIFGYYSIGRDAHPSEKELADALHTNRRTIRRLLKELVLAGMLEVRHRKSTRRAGWNQVNQYVPKRPPWAPTLVKEDKTVLL